MMKIGIFIFACFAFALAQQKCPSDIKANIAPPKTICSNNPNICLDNQVCCSCEWSDSSYCVFPVGTDPEEIKKSWDEYFQSSKGDKEEYDDDDCDDIMEDEHHHHDMHKEKGGPHHPHPHPEKEGDSHDWMHKNKRCHDKHHHKKMKRAIIGGSIGLVALVAIAIAVACLVRRRRMSGMQRKKSYIQSSLVSGDKAPLPPNMSAPELTKEELKATLGTDFTPSV